VDEVVTPAMKELIGQRTEPQAAPAPISDSELRRFLHATMETDPVHWSPEEAAGRPYGGVVAPPLYPVHAFRRPVGTPDPFTRFEADPDWDGTAARHSGLPKLELPYVRGLNGGVEADFFALAAEGDIVSASSAYVRIEDHEGRSGPMVIATTETEYRRQDGQKLVTVRSTQIRR
jgi:N-terminal half of MaoC dehydratase